MQTLYSRLSSIFILTIFFSLGAAAQYCAPVINTSGIAILQLNFTTWGDIAGGQTYYTTNTSSGYTQTLGSSAGTIKPYFGGNVFYSISNNGGSAKPYDFRVYADWNNDGDFNDAQEQIFTITGTVPGNSSSTTGTTIVPPLAAVPGDYRIRFTLSESAAATACGTYTGEVEDYKITVPINTAPVLNTSTNAKLNLLLSTVTNSNGIAMAEFINSSKPEANLISDANDRGAGWYDLVPRGIAVYGQSATNGTWQYKVGPGSWTNFGAVTSSNALLLMADPSYANYQTASRIRFVPTGTGTPTLTYRAWDGTSGSNGSYANIAGTGGTTAFSTANLTASLSVIATTGYDDNIFVATYDNAIYAAPLKKTTFVLGNAEPLLNSAPDYYSVDIAMDPAINKIFWIVGTNADRIASSNTNGTGQQLSLITGLTYSTGLATGNGKIFYWNWTSDYSAADLYQANTDGTAILKISGGAGQFNGAGVGDTRDIEFYNNKIYFQYSDGANFKIASANADGTGFTDLYSTTNYYGGLAVAANNIYWTETNGTINKMALTGGTVTVLATETGTFLNDIIVDYDGTMAYVVEPDAINPMYTLIRKVSTSGGTPVTVLTISGIASSLTFNTTGSVLPVTLLNFSGQYNGATHTSLLTWKTTAEYNFSHFTLERSTDMINFIPVTNVTATGTISQGSAYSYADNVKNISANKLYYRLKEVDLNGQYKYSNIVVLKVPADAIVSKLFPNPGKHMYTIQLSKAPTATVAVTVTNSMGQLVVTEKFNTKNYLLNLHGQAAGVYYLQLTFADGSKKQLTLIKE